MENKSIYDKLKNLDIKYWIIITVASFVLVLTLVLSLAFCGKGDETGNTRGEGSSETGGKDPGGTYDENGDYTGVQGTYDPNWDIN